MADKRVQIGIDDYSLSLLRVTEVKVSEEIDSDIVKTFDEPVSVPSSNGGFTIDIDALEARSITDFVTLKRILNAMKTGTGNISVYETVKHKEGNFEVENHFTGVSLSSNEVTYNAEDLTARSVSFNAEGHTEIVDGEEI